MSDSGIDGITALPNVYGSFEKANGSARITGPCGDTMEFWVLIQDERIHRCSFTTDGCESSVACGTATCALAGGTPEAVAFALEQADVLKLLPELSDESKHCALLAVNTLQQAITAYRNTHGGATS